jgi:dual specificity phosphatase 12
MESGLTMNEIVPNLWLGDLISALDADTLRAKGVQSVLSVMRGRVTVHEVR